MTGRERRRAIIFEVIENQLRDNNPPQTRDTLKRLLASGYSRDQAFHLIGCALGGEMFDIIHRNQEYDEERYVWRLSCLPHTPWLDEPTRFERWQRSVLPARCHHS